MTITKQTESKEAVKEQLKELGRKITATEAEVKLEDMPPLPHQGTVNKVPLDQLAPDKVKKVDAEQTTQLKTETAVPVAADATVRTMRDGEEAQRSLTECTVFVHDYETCCYYHPAGELEWACWGSVAVATWNDPQQDAEMSACGYPVYPFEVQGVELELWTADSSTVWLQFGIMDYYWDHCSPYPGDMLYLSDPIKFDNPSGFVYFGHYVDPPFCVYDRFFVFAELLNSDDYLDPDYCPDAPYQFQPSAIFDLSGWCERTYWIYGGYWQYGYWYDAVCELPAYGMGWSGVIRERAWGTTADENECPDSSFIWQKEGFFEMDTLGIDVLAYAPCGVPDFDQKFKEDAHPEIGPWDGPTAAANCLWWMSAGGMLDTWWQLDCQFEDPWDPDNPPCLINLLGAYMDLGTEGLSPEQLDAGLEALKTDKVLWFTHEEVDAPTWEVIEYNIRISQNVLLLLGLWYEDPQNPGQWFRIGGHWVTVAGVDYIHGLLKISDPDLDMAELGAAGEVCSFSYYIPHDPIPHPQDPSIHNDAGNVSHDVYPVMESITPCGVLMLVEYPYYELDLDKYTGKNLNPDCDYPIAAWDEVSVVYAEIEAAKIICPETPFKCETIWNYSATEDHWTGMTKCNYGRVGAQDDNGFWWDTWSNVYEVSALFDGSIILGNTSTNFAFYGGDNDAPGEFWPYIPLDYYYYLLTSRCIDPTTGDTADLYVNNVYTMYFHNFPKDMGLSLDIEMNAIGFDDPFYSAHNIVFDIYRITNTGASAITDLKFAHWKDWDLQPDGYDDRSGCDSDLGLYWIYNTGGDPTPFGDMILPVDGIAAERFLGVENPIYVHPNSGWGWDRDSLYNVMFGVDHDEWDTAGGPDDMSGIITTTPFSLDPGQTQTIVTLTGDGAPAPMGTFLYHALAFAGFYRGDVNMDGYANNADAIIIAQSYFGNLAFWSQPFADHGDVDNDGLPALSDAIRVAKTYFGQLPVTDMIDYPRFPTEIPFPVQSSMFSVTGFMDLGK